MKEVKNSPISVNFTSTGKVLHVCVDTERLHLESVSKSHMTLYHDNLYSNSKVMEKFGDGHTKDYEYVENVINTWVSRWENDNPFSTFTITDRSSGDFIGVATLAPSKEFVGAASVSIKFNEKYWGQGFASEVAAAMLNNYVPELVKREYKVNDHSFTTIVATARPDNLGSVATLVKMGFQYEGQREIFGHLRNEYSLNVTNQEGKKEADLTSLQPELAAASHNVYQQELAEHSNDSVKSPLVEELGVESISPISQM